jgi:hypothetical protein
MTDIDNMDIFGYWRVKAWSESHGAPGDDGQICIDDL